MCVYVSVLMGMMYMYAYLYYHMFSVSLYCSLRRVPHALRSRARKRTRGNAVGKANKPRVIDTHTPII
jgi:HD superfamily phosphohydrolase